MLALHQPETIVFNFRYSYMTLKIYVLIFHCVVVYMCMFGTKWFLSYLEMKFGMMSTIIAMFLSLILLEDLDLQIYCEKYAIQMISLLRVHI